MTTEVSSGSHHTAILANIFTRLTPGTTADCNRLDFRAVRPFFAGQRRHSNLGLPEGHGIRLEPGGLVAFQGHFDNISPCPQVASGYARMDLISESELTEEIATISMEKWDLDIPLQPSAEKSLSCQPEAWHVEEQTCIIPEDLGTIEVVGLTPHFHAAGRLFEVQFYDGERVHPEVIVRNDDWQHAPFKTLFDEGEAIRVQPGQGFKMRCSYYYNCEEHLENTPADSCPPSLRGSPDAEGEMCSLKLWYRGSVIRDVDSLDVRCF
jgi:hypothetical protein